MSSSQSKTAQHGIGAVASVCKRFLHPSKTVSEKYPNMRPDERLEGCLELRKEVKKVMRREQMCIILRHDDFPNIELHAVERWVKVTKPAASTFDTDTPIVGEQATATEGPTTTSTLPGDTINDAHQFLREGFSVDDDTRPNEENIGATTTTVGQVTYQPWGWDGIDPHKQANNQRSNPIFNVDQGRPIDDDNLLMSIFLNMLPWDFFTKTILPETNKHLTNDLTVGEFLRFIGLWLIMATTEGNQRNDFWASTPVSIFDGAPFRLNEYITGRRFKKILSALRLTSTDPPSFQDRFHPVRDLLDAFNKNMQKVFTPSWISCLDESMSVWFNRWTCPGWMFVPRKPHPFGNEYHTLCDGVWGVLYHLELVEGKHRPKELESPKFSEFGKTVGLVLRCCSSLFSTGKTVIMDSGFCVLDALTRLRSYGVFALIMIKKKGSWPRGIDGESIKEHMSTKTVGEVDCLPGLHNGHKFNIFCLKEPDYVTMLMGTFGSALPAGVDAAKVTRTIHGTSTTDTTRVSFELTEPFHLYYQYRGVVDSHNARRHSPISLEETWATKTWEHRVFAFVLAVCEINTYLVATNNYDFDDDVEYLKLRKKLAQSLIYNTYDDGVQPAKRLKVNSFYDEHFLERAPVFATQFVNGDWKFSESEKYPQRFCRGKGCKKRIRTYCRCSKGYWLCNEHHAEHLYIVKNA